DDRRLMIGDRRSPDHPITRSRDHPITRSPDSMSFFTHLECSVPCGAPTLDPHTRHHLCTCGAPLLVRYDLDQARAWSRGALTGREPNMWRSRELLPRLDREAPGTLGE